MSLLSRTFNLATLPARFAWRQTRTNLDAVRALRRDFRDWESVLQQASEETVDNLVRTLVAAERSLPENLETLPEEERRAEVARSLARSEKHLLAACGELYRSWRLATARDESIVFENPPQEQLRER